MSLWQAEVEKRRARGRTEKYALVQRALTLSRLEYTVKSGSNSVYTVVVDRLSVADQSCSCPDFGKTGLGTCKHIEAVRYSLGLPDEDPIVGPAWQVPEADLAGRDYALPPNIVCFDIETQRLFSEVGGRRNLDRLGLAVAVTYDSTTDTYEAWQEPQAAGLIEKLRNAGLVVGYNIIGFDYGVLQAYTSEPLHRLPTLDIMYEVARVLPYRPSLASVGQLTLGLGKSGDGLKAVEWFRAGQVDRVIAYCRDDVRLVRSLLGFALENGYLRCPDSGRPVQVATHWSRLLPAPSSSPRPGRPAALP